MSPGVPAPGVREVMRIAAIPNPVIRNLEITECYSGLAAAVASRGDRCSNWCTFATWASRQAGQTIRGEDLVDELQRELGRDAELLHPIASLWRALVRRGLFQRDTRLGRLVAELHTPFDAFELASDAVARGNRKVFAEIGLEFARYLEQCGPELRPDSAEFERFLDGLRTGPPPEGQESLRRAFTRYQQALFEPDAKRRAELTALAPKRRLLAWPLQRKLTQLSRKVITESLMVLTLPGAVLWLGRNLEAPGDVSDPGLRELMARYEPVPPAVDDCGAQDWSVLEQRMHYIVHLFRAYHLEGTLASPPFTPAQVERIRAGVLPDGEL